MGYSARYHAASLAAVFLALAVGILIGAGLGDNLLSDTEENLRESLEGDIEDARGEADELQVQLDRERAFASSASVMSSSRLPESPPREMTPIRRPRSTSPTSAG